MEFSLNGISPLVNNVHGAVLDRMQLFCVNPPAPAKSSLNEWVLALSGKTSGPGKLVKVSYWEDCCCPSLCDEKNDESWELVTCLAQMYTASYKSAEGPRKDYCTPHRLVLLRIPTVQLRKCSRDGFRKDCTSVVIKVSMTRMCRWPRAAAQFLYASQVPWCGVERLHGMVKACRGMLGILFPCKYVKECKIM